MLGEMIKRARQHKGLTLAGLAEKVGVSAGYISHIEKDKTTPSLGITLKLAEALDLPPERLLSDDKEHHRAIVVRKEDRSLIKYISMPFPMQFLSPVAQGGTFFKYTAVQFTFAPRAGWGNTTPVYFEHDECLLVLEGEVTCLFSGGETTVSKGGSIYAPRGALYSFDNRSDSEAVFILITKMEG